MNEKNLVICDEEFRYANSLGENIMKREELAFKIYTCSSIEKALALSKEKPIHVLVIDNQYSSKERKRIGAQQTFVLSKGLVEDLLEDECEIYKYQCADEIIRKILEGYEKQIGGNITRNIRKEKASMIAVYSPIHRVGKTQFALALGREFAKNGRTLYLNLEEYAGFSDVVYEGMNLGDLLYYIKQGNMNMGAHLQSAVRKMEELDYIWPIPIATDLKAISADEWEMFFEELLERSVYETIILDMGESIQGLLKILSACDKVYMPVLEDEISHRKIQQYEKNLEQLGLRQLIRITHRFVMPENIGEYAKIRVREEI